MVLGQPGQIVHKILFQKTPSQTKRAGGVVQVVESLLSKCKALSSNSITTKKKEREKFAPSTDQLLCHLEHLERLRYLVRAVFHLPCAPCPFPLHSSRLPAPPTYSPWEQPVTSLPPLHPTQPVPEHSHKPPPPPVPSSSRTAGPARATLLDLLGAGDVCGHLQQHSGLFLPQPHRGPSPSQQELFKETLPGVLW
jgi:hypothetical protein